jgi:hypothetical protein
MTSFTTFGIRMRFVHCRPSSAATTTGIAVCREFAATRQTRGKLFFPARQIYRTVTATFAASLLRPLPHLLPRLLSQDCSKFLFIFCCDFFRAVAATIAATIAATVAGHLSANTIELFTASIYALLDALIAANDNCSIFIPIAAQLPQIYP